jgi:hypothetical protein
MFFFFAGYLRLAMIIRMNYDVSPPGDYPKMANFVGSFSHLNITIWEIMSTIALRFKQQNV